MRDSIRRFALMIGISTVLVVTCLPETSAAQGCTSGLTCTAFAYSYETTSCPRAAAYEETYWQPAVFGGSWVFVSSPDEWRCTITVVKNGHLSAVESVTVFDPYSNPQAQLQQGLEPIVNAPTIDAIELTDDVVEIARGYLESASPIWVPEPPRGLYAILDWYE